LRSNSAAIAVAMAAPGIVAATWRNPKLPVTVVVASTDRISAAPENAMTTIAISAITSTIPRSRGQCGSARARAACVTAMRSGSSC